jgi:peptide/nickel transport system permease protein
MGLGTFIIRRVLLLIPTLIGVTILIFAVTMLLSPIQRAALYVRSPQQIRELPNIAAQYGLYDPAYVQYFRWLQQVLSGNLGFSITTNDLVLNQLLIRFPRTAEIVLPSIPLIIIIGIYLGVKSAVHRDHIIDHSTRFLAIFGWSLPTFWLAIMLLAIFYGYLGWFPPGTSGRPLGGAAVEFVTSSGSGWHTYTGFYTIDGLLNGQPWITLDAIKHLVLPTMTLVIINIALIIRIMRSSMLEALGKNYIITAKAKGLRNKEVINTHARRNALIPVITMSGLLTAGLLTGVIITETIFSIDGLGRMAANAALSRGVPDIPAVLGFALFACIVYVGANLVVDILYAYIDPRIRLG